MENQKILIELNGGNIEKMYTNKNRDYEIIIIDREDAKNGNPEPVKKRFPAGTFNFSSNAGIEKRIIDYLKSFAPQEEEVINES